MQLPDGVCGRCQTSGAEMRRLPLPTSPQFCVPCFDHLKDRWDRFITDATKYDRYYRGNYNLSLRRYGERFIAQLGRCAICGTEPEDQPLCVDHEHLSGGIRGLLCRTCNVGIGMLKDNPALLDVAADYLRDFVGDRGVKHVGSRRWREQNLGAQLTG